MKHNQQCKNGCREFYAKTFEQFTAQQDQMWEEFQNEHLALQTILEVELMPYLEKYANAGDEDARDLMITLSDFV